MCVSKLNLASAILCFSIISCGYKNLNTESVKDINFKNINDKVKYNLFGGVESVLEVNYHIRDSNGVFIKGERANLPPAMALYFDSIGYLNRIVYKNAMDTIEDIRVTRNLNENKIIWESITFPDKTYYTSRLLTLNKNGDIINEIHFNPKGKKTFSINSEYKASIQEASNFGYDGEFLFKTKTTFDSLGRIKRNENFDSDGKVIESINNRYENDFLKVSELKKREKKDVMKMKFNYKIDERDNWIEKTTIINGQPKFITIREIRYFQK
jgi:hypothetical protein